MIFNFNNMLNKNQNEIKVGEVFQCGLIKLKCIKCDDGKHSCDGCFFCGKGYCSNIQRKDKIMLYLLKQKNNSMELNDFQLI